jgi:hypothetical protein
MIVVAVLMAIVMAASATSGTDTAAAESCFKTVRSEEGAFTTSSCSIAGPEFTWVWAGNTFGWNRTSRGIGTGQEIYCVKVETNLPSWFTNSVCSVESQSTGFWSLVYAKAGWIWGINPVTATSKGATVITTTTGKISCAELAISAKPKAEKVTAQVMTVEFKKCTAFGLAATVSTAEIEFSAEGYVGVVNKSIVVTVPEKCTVTIPSGGSNAVLHEIAYTNKEEKANELKVLGIANISGLNYEPSGGICGTKKLETNGKLTSELEFVQEKGSVSVVLTPVP